MYLDNLINVLKWIINGFQYVHLLRIHSKQSSMSEAGTQEEEEEPNNDFQHGECSCTSCSHKKKRHNKVLQLMKAPRYCFINSLSTSYIQWAAHQLHQRQHTSNLHAQQAWLNRHKPYRSQEPRHNKQTTHIRPESRKRKESTPVSDNQTCEEWNIKRGCLEKERRNLTGAENMWALERTWGTWHGVTHERGVTYWSKKTDTEKMHFIILILKFFSLNARWPLWWFGFSQLLGCCSLPLFLT